jgi:hypothetical protein
MEYHIHFQTTKLRRKQMAAGFLKKTSTSFYEITTGAFCCQGEVIYL